MIEKQAATLFKTQEEFPRGTSVPFTGRGHQPGTPGTNSPCSETRLCRISKPSVSKGNQKCFYLLHNTDVLIRALISSEGKLKSDDMYKTHTLLSLSHAQRQSIIRWTVEAEIKKNNCRKSVKNARLGDQVAFLCQQAGWLYGVTLPSKHYHFLSDSLSTLYIQICSVFLLLFIQSLD